MLGLLLFSGLSLKPPSVPMPKYLKAVVIEAPTAKDRAPNKAAEANKLRQQAEQKKLRQRQVRKKKRAQEKRKKELALKKKQEQDRKNKEQKKLAQKKREQQKKEALRKKREQDKNKAAQQRKEEARRLSEEEERQRIETLRQQQLLEDQRRQKLLSQEKAQAEAQKEKQRLEALKRKQSLELERQAQARAGKDASIIAKYRTLMMQKVQHHWIRPPNARSGMRVTLRIKMIPGGEVVSVMVIQSSGNPALDYSAEQAVLKAAVLPVPSDMELFDREFRSVTVIFDPEDL